MLAPPDLHLDATPYRVLHPTVHIRAEPTTSAAIRRSVRSGAFLWISAVDNNWATLEADGGFAMVDGAPLGLPVLIEPLPVIIHPLVSGNSDPTVQPAKPARLFRCQRCNSAFRTPMLLRGHSKNCSVCEPVGDRLPRVALLATTVHFVFESFLNSIEYASGGWAASHHRAGGAVQLEQCIDRTKTATGAFWASWALFRWLAQNTDCTMIGLAERAGDKVARSRLYTRLVTSWFERRTSTQ